MQFISFKNEDTQGKPKNSLLPGTRMGTNLVSVGHDEMGGGLASGLGQGVGFGIGLLAFGTLYSLWRSSRVQAARARFTT